jgi:hypothetical protein
MTFVAVIMGSYEHISLIINIYITITSFNDVSKLTPFIDHRYLPTLHSFVGMNYL